MDDCENYELSLNANLIMFENSYKELMRIKPTSKENKEKIEKKIKLIDQLIPSTNKFFEKYINEMKKCKLDHKMKIKETEEKKKKFKEMSEQYNLNVNKLYLENFEEKEENNKELKNSTNEEEEEIKFQVGKLLSDDPNYICGVSKSELKKIIEIKNSMKKTLDEIGEILKQNDYQFEQIESNVEKVLDDIIIGNGELKEAAKIHIERRALEIKMKVTYVLTTILYYIPGFRSLPKSALVGFGGGNLIGNLIEKMGKKYLDMIDKKQY